MEDTFLEKVNFIPESGCWWWSGALDKDGYGIDRYQGKKARAHRVSFQIFNGKIPEGMIIMHSCDNPSCVNPDHLSAGTNKQNSEDMKAKGRCNPMNGSKRKDAKLNERDIPEIRDLAKIMYKKDIAELYGVARTTVSSVINGHSWSHV